MTLCVVHNNTRVLLGMKKQGFGAGRWNGFGGKVHEGETVEAAAKRELHEEAGIVPIAIEKEGTLTFEFEGNPELLEVHLFRVNEFSGEPTESEEMRPQWFSHTDIPFHEMWPDDRFWLPRFLAGKRTSGYFLFKDENTLLRHHIEEA